MYLYLSDRACLKQTNKQTNKEKNTTPASKQVKSRHFVRSFLFNDFVEKVTKS